MSSRHDEQTLAQAEGIYMHANPGDCRQGLEDLYLQRNRNSFYHACTALLCLPILTLANPGHPWCLHYWLMHKGFPRTCQRRNRKCAALLQPAAGRQMVGATQLPAGHCTGAAHSITAALAAAAFPRRTQPTGPASWQQTPWRCSTTSAGCAPTSSACPWEVSHLFHTSSSRPWQLTCLRPGLWRHLITPAAAE
jgi:hypothetical protein